MTHAFRRVRWKVRRVHDGWLPIVLIGEEPVTYRCSPVKASARAYARARAVELRDVGQQ